MSSTWPLTRRPHPLATRASTTRGSPTLLLWMLAAIVAVASLAYWDSARESAVALVEFEEEQATLAAASAAAVEAKLHDGRSDATRYLALVSGLRTIEHAGRILLLRPPGIRDLVASDGRHVQAARIADAMDRGERSLRLSRPEARALGLPERTAMAGLSTFDVGPLGRWGIAVIASAEHARDHGRRAQWRLVLSVLLASGLVVAFGGLALRKQRKELELSREIAIAEVQQERDERLVRADKLATMGALATGIAHEVSTPLGVILGRAEQLAPRLEGDEKAKRAAEAIIAQAERITRIIRAFLSLARGDAPALVHVDPGEIARACTELVEHRFDKAGVSLAQRIPPDLPRIACDPRLFEQAIVNLLLNACDACQVGGHVELRIEASNDRVAYVVTDDGSGISSEAAARATEPFFTTKPAEKGTGLGLAIANEIVKHHQGTLTIMPRDASGNGASTNGTRACVEVPVANGADDARDA